MILSSLSAFQLVIVGLAVALLLWITIVNVKKELRKALLPDEPTRKTDDASNRESSIPEASAAADKGSVSEEELAVLAAASAYYIIKKKRG